MRYLLGTGCCKIENLTRWIDCCARNIAVTPSRVVVIGQGSVLDNSHIGDLGHPRMYFCQPMLAVRLSAVSLDGNPGHVSQLMSGAKPHHFGGWSAAVMALAMLAYCDESDFVYIEEDVVIHGDVVARMYEEIRDGQMIFGDLKHGDGTAMMPCAQGVFLIKNAFIPEFVRMYLASPPENADHQLPEHTFDRLEKTDPQIRMRRFSFGYDRSRPKEGLEACEDEVAYFQHLTADELEILKRKGWL